MSTPPAVSRYNRYLVVLHWVMALLIVSAFALTYIWDIFPRDARGPWRELHKSFGFLVFLFVLLRIAVRATGAVPADANADSLLLRLASKGAHLALYLLMLAVTVVGLFLAHSGINFFGLVHIPALPRLPPMIDGSLRGIHSLFANSLVILAGVHALAALYHHFIVRDGLLRRMAFGRDSADGSAPS